MQLTVDDGYAANTDTVTITAGNVTPVADAGPDQTTVVGATVTLSGELSHDADGDPLIYQWWFSSKPTTSAAALVDSTNVRPTFTVDAPGTYIVKLVVHVGTITSAVDTMVVTTVNSRPVADAGVEGKFPSGATVMLDGSSSTDVDGDLLTYVWALTTKPESSTATLLDPTAARPTFTIDQPGDYVAQLIVTDAQQAESAPDTVVISTINAKPIANAGLDQHGAVGALITLDGSASSDPDGQTLTYAWTLLTAPEGSVAALQNPTTAQPTFVLDRPGHYVAQLVVHDGQFDSTPDFVTISTENSRPVADPGDDQTPAAGAVVFLDGSQSFDADGDTLSYFWSFTTVPSGSTVTLTGGATATPSFLPDLTGGAYILQLIVSDGELNSEPKTVTITAPDRTLIDDDGDGLTEQQGDCNDANLNAYPGAVEILDNGVDEDCDGSDDHALGIVFTPGAPSVPVNGTVTVTITAPGLEGVAPAQVVSAFDLEVHYNQAVLQLTDVAFGASLSPSLQRSGVVTAGAYDLAEVSLQPDAVLDQVQPDTVVLVTLTFTAIGTGTSTVTLGPDPSFGRDVKGLDAQVLPVSLAGATTTITVTP